MHLIVVDAQRFAKISRHLYCYIVVVVIYIHIFFVVIVVLFFSFRLVSI